MIKTNTEFELFLKSKLAENGLNVSKLASILNTSPQNLSQKIKLCTLKYPEIVKIADILGYSIEWVKNN